MHRLIRDNRRKESGDEGMVFELPSSTSRGSDDDKETKEKLGEGGPDHSAEASQDKLEAISIEYAYIMSAQLDSQRVYYEDEMASRLDQNSTLTRKWEEALASAEKQKKLRIEVEKRLDAAEKLASSERTQAAEMLALTVRAAQDDAAARKKEKLELTKARKEFESLWSAEKAISSSLVQNLTHLRGEVKLREQETAEMREQVTELQDQMRDVMFALSARDTIEQQGGEGELAGGSVSMPPAVDEAKKKTKKKKK